MSVEITVDWLGKLTREVCPMLVRYPERAVSFLAAEPRIPGMWLNRSIPNWMREYPIALYGSARVGGHQKRGKAARAVQLYQDALAEQGYTCDLSPEQIQRAVHHIIGVVVLRPALDDPPTFRDPYFKKVWLPFAQVWRLHEPLFYHRSDAYLEYLPERVRYELARRLRRAATRVL